MAKQMRKDIGDFDVPELSHPNYRQLDWGPDLLTKRGFRLFKGVSYWTEKEPHHGLATQCDEPMSPEEIRGLFRKYQNPNVVSFFYDAALLRECDQQQNMIGKNVENLIGCQRALINSRQFMNKCEQRLLKECGMIEDIRVSTDQRPRSRRYLSRKHSLGTILHSPMPFRYSKYDPNRKARCSWSGIRWKTRFHSRSSTKYRASSAPGKMSIAFQPSRMSNIARARRIFMASQTVPEVADAIAKRASSVDSKKMKFLFKLAGLALDMCPAVPTNHVQITRLKKSRSRENDKRPSRLSRRSHRIISPQLEL